MRPLWMIAISLTAALGLGLAAAQMLLAPRAGGALHAPPSGGIAPEEADALIARARALNSAGLLVVRGGETLLAWGDVDVPYDVRSIRKSVNNLILGRLILEDRLDLDATLAELGIDDALHPLSETEKTATVRQLMEARSGVYLPAARETGSAADERPARGAHAPGTFWYYNNWDFNALEVIAARAAGDDDWCATFARYAAPLLGVADPEERCEPRREPGAAHPAHVLRLSARELARLGEIYAEDGVADGARVLSEGWAGWSGEPVSDFHFIATSKFNYGRLFWSIDPYGPFAGRTMMARGAGSQYLWIDPDSGLVIVHLVRTRPLYLRQRLGLIPDDNDAWTFGGQVASAVLDEDMKTPDRLY